MSSNQQQNNLSSSSSANNVEDDEEDINNIPLADDDPQALIPEDDLLTNNTISHSSSIVSSSSGAAGAGERGGDHHGGSAHHHHHHGLTRSFDSFPSTFTNDSLSSADLSQDEQEEKASRIAQVLELQNTLDDLSQRVDTVKGGEPQAEIREPGPGPVHRVAHVRVQRFPARVSEEQAEPAHQLLHVVRLHAVVCTRLVFLRTLFTFWGDDLFSLP